MCVYVCREAPVLATKTNDFRHFTLLSNNAYYSAWTVSHFAEIWPRIYVFVRYYMAQRECSKIKLNKEVAEYGLRGQFLSSHLWTYKNTSTLFMHELWQYLHCLLYLIYTTNKTNCAT